MRRHIINISSYRYLIEYYDAVHDMENSQYLSEFVMLRNYTILNDLVHDNDIYIIERKYFNEYLEELVNSGDEVVDFPIAFPVTNGKINSYSNNYVKFNDNFNLSDNKSILDKSADGELLLGKDVYQLLGKDRKPKAIKCDKIRIYHPHTKKSLKGIISISNYINNVHFHYLCKPLMSYPTNSETEIKFNNEDYSEYIEVFFPSMSDLFAIDNEGNYNVFYIEDFNIIASTQNENFINSIMSNDSEIEHFEDGSNKGQLVPFNLFIQPYRIVEEYASNSEFNYDDNLANDEKIFVKLYLKNNMSINNNYLTNTLNIVIYPYSEIDASTNLYILDGDLSQGYISINNESKFSLMSRLGFSDGIISIVSLFSYPNKSYFYSMYKDDGTTSPIKEAYKYYNNIDEKYYHMFVNEEVMEELRAIDEVEEISDAIKNTVKEVANVNYANDIDILNAWKNLMKQTIIAEYEEDFGTEVYFLGFKIEMASDRKFKHIIYEDNIRINFNDLDDFAFNLNGIFKRWENKPEELVIRCTFIDRILGIEICGNTVIITKEWFKYLINDSPVSRLTDISSINKNIINDPMKVIELNNESTINFINTIKCIVRKEADNNVSLGKRSIDQKVIFKPIFYKVKDLQSITLRSGVTQNIGLNLAEYMTKVDVFKIVIGENEYIETGRNDIFVIFKINANDMTTMSGIYNVIDGDGGYISSGNWNIV